MAFEFHIRDLAFSGGEHVEPLPGSLTIFLGPNNGGKSTALRDIQSFFSQPGSPRLVVETLVAERGGSSEDFSAWLRASFPIRHPSGNPPMFASRGFWLPETQAEKSWEGDNLLRYAHGFIINLLGTEDRLTLAKYTRSLDMDATPEFYIHILQSRDQLEKTVRSHVRAAFKTDLIINRAAGRNVGFHVGIEPERTVENDRVSEKYATELLKLPRLDDQGDGLKSYVGTLLAAFCGAHPVLLLDEPEAFLHPPQARRIAGALAAAAAADRQIFVATHSSAFVEGAIASGRPVTIVRVTREGDQNHAAILPADELNALRSVPLLRSASAIEGMFHQGVVACESDADSHFYESALRLRESKVGGAPVDLYFSHGTGKGSLAVLANAYRRLSVRTAVVADLDLLRNAAELGAVCAALGIEPKSIEAKTNEVRNALADQGPLMSTDELLGEMERLQDEVRQEGRLPSDGKRRLQRLADDASDWSKAKRMGINLLRGAPRMTADALLDELRQSGLFLVPAGELEGWYPHGSPDKSKWFGEAMGALQNDATEMGELSSFSDGLIRFFGYSILPAN